MITTKAEYEAYEERVKEFLKREELKTIWTRSRLNEAYYTAIPCDVCKDAQAGVKVDMRGVMENGEKTEHLYSVCTGCEYYIAYGKLDDQTMLAIEDNERKEQSG